MRRSIPALAAMALVATAVAAHSQGVPPDLRGHFAGPPRVVIDGIRPGAVIDGRAFRNGRVFVPALPALAAFGARQHFDGRRFQVVFPSQRDFFFPHRDVVFFPGRRFALIYGRLVRLPAAPVLVGGRLFLPIDAFPILGVPVLQPFPTLFFLPSPFVDRFRLPIFFFTFERRFPVPGVIVRDRFAPVTAAFRLPPGLALADSQAVTVRLDGRDITRDTQIGPGGFTFRPTTPLSPGMHTVAVDALTTPPALVTGSWNFVVE